MEGHFKEIILQYLCFSGDLDEEVHVLIPNKGHVVFSWDNDIKHEVKCILFHFVSYTRIFPRNSKGFISQYDCQILEENLSASYNLSTSYKVSSFLKFRCCDIAAGKQYFLIEQFTVK